MKKELPRYSRCFICGDRNEIGLKLEFVYESGKAKTEFVTAPGFEGYKGILHGGILGSVLDEVMIKAILAEGIVTVTYRLEITFRKMIEIGEKISAEGWIIEKKERVIKTEGRVLDCLGALVAEAKGIYLRVREELADRLTSGLD